MKMLARTKFSQNNIKVPDQWQPPQGNEAQQHYGMAFKPADKIGTPDTNCIPPLFLPQTMHKSHTDVQKGLNKNFGTYIDKITSAICSAWDTTQKLATMTGVVINGMAALGGQVIWPPMGSLILAQGPMSTPGEMKYTKVVASVIDTAWASYIATIKVTGLPWYPAFMACPAPTAIPTPNVPTPVASLTQVTTPVSASVMKMQMISQFGVPDAMYHKELFDCICDAFEKSFLLWQGTCMVTNVIGAGGAVPSMTTPVPVPGPVVAAVGTMPPGGFK
jgi:hypothetical protein